MKKLDTFSSFIKGINLIKNDEKDTYEIEGIISSENIDTSGEIILQNGLDFSYFLKNGHLNYDHMNDPKNILGAPEKVYRTTVNGKPATAMKGYLYAKKGIVADLVENYQVMSKTGLRQLGFSIEGQVLARDARNPNIITKAKVLNCSVTHSPCNTDAVVGIVKNALMQEKEITENEVLSKPYPNEIAIRFADPNDYKYFRRTEVPENHHWAKKFGQKNVAYIYGLDKKTGKIEIQAARIKVKDPNEYSKEEIEEYLKERKLSPIKVEMPKGYKKMDMKKDLEDKLEEITPETEMEQEAEYASSQKYDDLHLTMHQSDLLYEYSEKLQELLQKLPVDFDFPEWVQMKIILATDYIHSAYHYLVRDALEQAGMEQEIEVEQQDQVDMQPEIEKDEGSISPIVEESLEGKKDEEDDSMSEEDELASEDYSLSPEELKMLVETITSQYGDKLSDKEILDFIHKLLMDKGWHKKKKYK